jgi:hypothetical protein
MAIDLTAPWDFSRPDVSEPYSRAASTSATGDGALILRAAGLPDPYVFEELEAPYRVVGDGPKARSYAERAAVARREETSR